MAKITKRPASIDNIRWIADNGACKLVWPLAENPNARKPVLVDALTARALLAVRAALGPSAQERFDNMVASDFYRFNRCVDFAWKHVRLA
jgi:hypothetical protein